MIVSGEYDVTPDRQPILGPVPGHDGLYVAAGFSGHGFMIAPAVGRIVADAVVGDARYGARHPRLPTLRRKVARCPSRR